MSDPMRVRVTGAGSGVGQGVMKALRASTLPVRVVAADIGPFNAGLYRGEEAVLIPRVEDAGALDGMIEAINRAGVRAVLIGSEFDVEFFAIHREDIESRTGATVVVSPVETVRIADDKWLTAEFLRERGLSAPRSAIPSEGESAADLAAEWGFPVIVKARSDQGNRP